MIDCGSVPCQSASKDCVLFNDLLLPVVAFFLVAENGVTVRRTDNFADLGGEAGDATRPVVDVVTKADALPVVVATRAAVEMIRDDRRNGDVGWLCLALRVAVILEPTRFEAAAAAMVEFLQHRKDRRNRKCG